MHKLLVVVALLAAVGPCRAKEWFVYTLGHFYCHGKALESADVELWENDMLGPDDKLNATVTDKLGGFRLQGSEKELTKISPYLKVIHKCKGSPETVKIGIPKDCVQESPSAAILTPFSVVREMAKPQ